MGRKYGFYGETTGEISSQEKKEEKTGLARATKATEKTEKRDGGDQISRVY